MLTQPYTPSPARRCLLRQVCAALKVLAAGNSFQDVAFEPTRLRIPPVPCTKLSSPHNERAQNCYRRKFPTKSCHKTFTFFATFCSHKKRSWIFLVTPTISKGIVKSCPGRSKTPRSWCDQLETTIYREPISSYQNFGSLRLPRGADSSRLIYYKMKKRSAVRSRISSKLIFATCLGYFDRGYYGFCLTSLKMLVLIEGNKIWQLWNSVRV